MPRLGPWLVGALLCQDPLLCQDALLPQDVATVAELRLRTPPQLDLAGGPALPAELRSAPVADGVLDLRDLAAAATFGPHAALAVSSSASFTFAVELRTRRADFGTILMSRADHAVHFSLVMGREPGRVSLELWSWQRDKLLSTARLDDGAWHHVEAAYDAAHQTMALTIDGRLDAVLRVNERFTGGGAPRLRLGQNLDDGVRQPFGGELRAFALRRGSSATLQQRFVLQARSCGLAAGAAERAVLAWWDFERRARPPQAADAAAWQREAAALRARVQDALGLWPPPYSGRHLAGAASPLSGGEAAATAFATFEPQLDLAVREGGTLTRAEHSVTRIYWQTFAGYFASGWLYRPRAAATGKRPAILCPHGHWHDGARHPVVQARCVALAQQGYVVLAVDSIHLYDDRVALSPLSVMTWHNLRGLELLRKLPDVDPQRLGCTGASGGAQQTYYLTALDTGLAAAVPAVMACHFEDILHPGDVHCACNHTPHLLRAADMPQMAAAFAPRPQLFLTVSGDWTRRFHEYGFPAVRAIYGQFDVADRVAVRRWDKGHDYDQPMREAMYAFFARTLRGDALAEPREPVGGAPVESVRDLRALELPDVPADPATIVAEFRARLAAPTGRSVDVVRTSLRALFEHGERGSPLPARRVGDLAVGTMRGERWVVPSDSVIELPAVLLRPAGSPQRTVLMIGSGDGKLGCLTDEAALLGELVARGCAVLLVDVRYTGELDVGASWRGLYGRFRGLDEGVLAVRDLRRCIDALPDLQLPGSPTVVGRGLGGAVALFAAALDPRIAVVAVPERGPDYRAVDRQPRLARVLLHGDLDDAERLIAPRPILRGALSAAALLGAKGD